MNKVQFIDCRVQSTVFSRTDKNANVGQSSAAMSKEAEERSCKEEFPEPSVRNHGSESRKIAKITERLHENLVIGPIEKQDLCMGHVILA